MSNLNTACTFSSTIRIVLTAIVLLVSFPLFAVRADLNIPSYYKLKTYDGKGIVVFSVTDNCPSTLYLRIKGIRYNGRRNWHRRDVKVDYGRNGKLDWKKPCGRLLILEFEKGLFKLFGYAAHERPSKGKVSKKFDLRKRAKKILQVADSYRFFGGVVPKKEFGIYFKVVPGKITYAGSLHFMRDTDKKITQIQVVNNRKRDLKILFSRMPQFKKSDIIFKKWQ